MSSSLRPFEQLPFDKIPAHPRVPHPYLTLPSREVQVDVDGVGIRTHVKVKGKGPPLLLVHGLMTSSYSFRYVVGPLGQHFTCYIPDLPGAGQTEPKDVPYTPSFLGRYLLALTHALGIDGCACVANSMGGYIAMVAALDAGKAPSFSRLVVLHAPAVPLPRYRALGIVMRLPGSFGLLEALVRGDPQRWAHEKVHYQDETLKSQEEAKVYGAPLSTSAGRRSFWRYLHDTLDERLLEKFELDLQVRRDTGKRFPIPLQLQYVAYDPVVPAITGPRLKACLPDAEYIELKHGSHFAHVDAVDTFLPPTLAFLAKK
ncbi:MAG: alpha/beta hydrolase [Deltaproteobacteria bacterium]|nr:alpha/beta hydrolase [Deltaproteobacteria bacterium]